MQDDIRMMITGVAEGAARGAAALREHGVALELDGYSVEAHIGEDRTTAAIRLDFVVPRER